MLFPISLFAQGINITSGGKIAATGAAAIQINNGNFVNNGTYTKASETVTLSGNTAKEMSGSSTTSLNNLSITNTGGITTKLSQLTASALTIATGSKFTIDTVKAVTVSTSITNSAGASGLLIKSSADRANGTLIFHNSVESPVQATIEMYSKASKVSTSFKWQFFGIPVRNYVKNPTFVDGVNYVRKFNEAGTGYGLPLTSHWVQLQNGNTLTPFTGYEVNQPVAQTYSFAGELVNSGFDSGKLAYTDGAQYPGQHLIGNPYTAAINISDIEFGSPLEAIIENSVYLYNTGSLADWTSAGSGNASVTESSTPGQYIVVPKNIANRGLGIPGQIPSMGAFLVKVKKYDDLGWVKISYPANDAGTSLVKNTTLQRSPSVGLPCTRIDVKGANFGDRMWIFTEPTCSRGFDNGWDGYKEFGSTATPQLFAIEQSGNYQVNSVDNIHNTKLGFVAGSGTIDYTFTFTHQNIEDTYPVLYLFDTDSLKYTDITESGTQVHITSSNKSTSESRLKIVTEIDKTTVNKTITNSGLWLHNSQNTIFIHNFTAESGTIELFDLAGRKVQIFAFNANTTTTLSTSISAGSYLAKAQTKIKKTTLPIIIR
jgi:hypothetical protein